MKGDFWVFQEAPVDLALVSHGGRLAKQVGKDLSVVCLGECDSLSLAQCGVKRVFALPPGLSEHICAAILETLCREEQPEVFLFPATVYSRMVAALTAAALSSGLVADCTRVEWGEAGLVQTRPAFGSSFLADIITRGTPQIATVRRGAVPLQLNMGCTVQPEVISIGAPELSRIPIYLSGESRNEQALHSAEIIVSGGYGIGSSENFRVLETLAERLGAGLGASRAAVNAGYAPYRCQVGLTGQIVRPRLYVAFGISGAVQHLVGMEAADTVVAVNTDARAPIFSYADYGIEADWRVVAERLLELLPTAISAEHVLATLRL